MKHSQQRVAAFFFAASTVLFGTQPVALGHAFDYGAIKTTLVGQGDALALHMEVPQQITADAPDASSELALFNNYFNQDIVITNRGAPCRIELSSFDASSETQTVFDGTIACSIPITSVDNLTIHMDVFADFFGSFDNFVTIAIGDKRWDLVFSADNLDFPGTVTAVYHGSSFERFFAVARQFTWLGMQHIWSGYDHMLFILSIILLLRAWKKILALVTAFTVAHSLTLILAGLKLVTVSPRLVDPLIALSIAYMAYRNIVLLIKREEAAHIPERWKATFGFGLIHGLGFAGALLQAGVPQTFFVPSLVVFNVGIEIGQAAVVLAILPIILQIDALRSRRTVLGGISAVITLLALIWFVQRVAH